MVRSAVSGVNKIQIQNAQRDCAPFSIGSKSKRLPPSIDWNRGLALDKWCLLVVYSAEARKAGDSFFFLFFLH